MRKKILIPTDFSIASLNVVKSFLSKAASNCKYDIILLHGVHMSDSITDLLFFSKRNLIDSLSSAEFDEACSVIKNKFASQINSIRKDIFTGVNQAAFENYVEAHQIDEAYIPAHYEMNFSSSKSFDVIPFIKKSAVKTDAIDWNIDTAIPEKGKLAEVFLN